METPDLPSLPNLEEAKMSLARTLVNLLSDEGRTMQDFRTELDGQSWTVTVAVADTRDDETDFTETLPE
jgi:hypothetical protein